MVNYRMKNDVVLLLCYVTLRDVMVCHVELWCFVLWWSRVNVEEVIGWLIIFQYPCFECDGEMPDVLKKAMATLEQVRVLRVIQYKRS